MRGRLVLDLACGEGYNTRMLARKGAKVTGIDSSAKMIELAAQEETKEKLGIRYLVADASDLSQLPNSHFDIVPVSCLCRILKTLKRQCPKLREF